jgi:CBS domain containing-hemolysin-like protein
MKRFNLYQLEAVDKLAHPDLTSGITLDSPALSVMTDFKYQEPLVADSHDRACDIEQSMLQAHVRMKLVVNQDNEFLGLVSLDDLNAQEILKRVAKGAHREELSAGDFMRPKDSLRALDYHELRQATIRDIVQTLKDNEYQHYLVVDRKEHKIRGVISASDLARKLRLDININSRSSFVNVYAALYPEPLLH